MILGLTGTGLSITYLVYGVYMMSNEEIISFLIDVIDSNFLQTEHLDHYIYYLRQNTEQLYNHRESEELLWSFLKQAIAERRGIDLNE